MMIHIPSFIERGSVNDSIRMAIEVVGIEKVLNAVEF